MILYEVTLDAEPAVAPAVEEHMRRKHIPAILASACFRRIRFAQASSTRFRTSYEAESQADLDRYLREYAPALRAEFQAEFAAGVTVTREIWIEREVWESGSGTP
ncbi:MAG TPA: DUF4286 family protein [Gemmatimonadales bacterium]|jgi:hypothetical protein